MEPALVLIVEDQVVIAKSIEAMIIDHGMVVIGICKTGEEAIAITNKRIPDIVIMDIRLQGKMDGIQTAKALQDIEHIPIIYLSDYTDKGTVRKAKETNPANYLSKPFTETDLIRAVEIAIHNANTHRLKASNDEEFIFIKTQKSYSKIHYNDILYIEAERAYCNIHTLNNAYTQSISMGAVAEQLNPERFVKIHRSYIVNIRKITEFNSAEVTVVGRKLPVSDQHRSELMTRLKVIH